MWVLTHVTGMEHRLFHSVTHGVPLENLLDRAVLLGFEFGWGVGVQGWGGGGSGRVVLIDNGRVNQSKAAEWADALVQVKTTKFGTNVGLNMLLNISSRYFGGLFWSRQLRGLPSSDGYFFLDNDLSPDRCQAIIWNNAGILLIGPLGTKFNEILILIHTFLFKKIHLKMLSGKWRPFCLGLNVCPYMIVVTDHGQSSYLGCFFSL